MLIESTEVVYISLIGTWIGLLGYLILQIPRFRAEADKLKADTAHVRAQTKLIQTQTAHLEQQIALTQEVSGMVTSGVAISDKTAVN